MVRDERTEPYSSTGHDMRAIEDRRKVLPRNTEKGKFEMNCINNHQNRHLVCKWLSEWIIGEVYKLDVLECISLIFFLKLYFDIIGNVHTIYNNIHYQIQGGDIEKVTEKQVNN